MKKITIRWKNYFLLLLLPLASLNLVSQQIPTIIPPAPNAANLGQYISTPIGHYTGTPNISVPIWTITEGKLTLPVSLNYRAGGIKVSEMASSCGLGWVLNAGAAITRSVVGLMDETPGAGYLNSRYPYVENDNSYMNAIIDGGVDGQQDLFFYNLPAGGGRFVFDKSQAIHTIPRQNIKINQGNIESLPFYQGFATAYTSWNITDQNGVLYKFQDYEKTSSTGPSNINWAVNTWYLTEMVAPTGEKIIFNYENIDLDYDLPGTKTNWILVQGSSEFMMSTPFHNPRQIINGKRLSSIVFTNGKIEFIPSATGRADLIGDKALEKIVVKDKAGNIIKQFRLHYQYMIGTSMVDYNAVNYSGETNHITTSNEQFLYGSFRRRLMLQKVVEEDKNGVALNNGRQFDYIHNYGLPNRASAVMDHWGFANNNDDPLTERPQFINVFGNFDLTCKAANPIYVKQGSLYRITHPTGGYTEYEYESNYAEASPATPTSELITGALAGLPFSHASYLTQESFEYEERTYQGATTRHYYVPFMLNISPQSQITIKLANVPFNTGQFGFYIENVEDPNVKLWIGTNNGTYQLNLGPGNYRLYHYPSPAILANNSDPNYGALYDAQISGSFYYTPPTTGGGTLVGGIRVKKQIDHDPVANNTITKAYSYEMDGISTGHLLSKPEYVYNYEITNASPNANWQQYKVCTYGSVYPLSTTHGSFIGYHFVEEKSIAQDGTPLGKTEYNFRSPNSEPDIFYTEGNITINPQWGSQIFPNPPVDNRDWLRGLLLAQRDYNYIGGGYQEVHTIENTYTKSVDSVSRGIKMDVFGQDMGSSHHTAALNFYYYYSGFNYLSETKEKFYNGSSAITTRLQTLLSSKSLLPVKQTLYKSDGSLTYVYNSYPLEYPPGTPFIDNLVQKNIVSASIEQVKLHEPAFESYNVVEGKISTYRADNALPDEVYQLETSSTLPLWQFKFSNAAIGELPSPTNGTFYQPDSRYKLRLKYNAYDNKGNLLETQRANDMMNAYVWGYDQTMPIAQAMNALAKDIFYTSFEDADGNSTEGDSKAGKKSRTGGYSKSLAALTNGLYMLTWWQKSGSTWNLQKALASVTAGTYTINVSGQVDELRFHPTTAQMSSYTYEPMVGMTSSSDQRNDISYFEYDNFARLLLVRDADLNIKKQYQYQFATFDHSNPLWEYTGNIRCEPCPANSNYTTSMQQKEEKDINPNSPTWNQFRWTNIGATCFVSPGWQATGNLRCVKDGANNNTGQQEREEKDMNPCSSTYNQLRWMDIGQNLTACPLPSNCNSGNCSGADKKCINGVCETGVKVWFGGPQIGPNLWQCSYRYQFSDGSLSTQTLTENHSSPCPNDFEG